jgi:hypothetical protein
MNRRRGSTAGRLLAALTTLIITVGLVSLGGVAASATECAGPSVAVVAADYSAYLTDVVTKLWATCRFHQVDGIDAVSSTPTLGSLSGYQAVLVYSDYDFADNTAMGNVLADYVDGGGHLVVATFAFWSSDMQLGMGGRLSTGNYLPFTQARAYSGGYLQLQADLPDSPYLANVGSFSGGSTGGMGGSFYNDVALASGATQIAHWNNGASTPLVAVKGDVVGLNFFPPSSDASSDFWDASTDGDVLMANALVVGATVPIHHEAQVTVGSGLELQTKSITRGDQATFVFTITNAGNVRDRFTVLGGTDGALIVRYVAGRTDVTAAVLAGTYVTKRCGPGRAEKIKLQVQLRPGAVTGDTYQIGLVGTSVLDPAESDDAFAELLV